jgi:hypothetical protein
MLSFLMNKDSMSFTDFLWESELSLVFGLFHGLATGGILSSKRMYNFNLQTPSLKRNAAKLVLLLITTTAFSSALFLSEHLKNKVVACSFIYIESYLLGFWVLYIAPIIIKRFSFNQK